MNLVIPSFKRWHNLEGKDYFKTAKYVIPEAQRDDYLKVLAIDRLIVIPNECDGSITKKRNWILKNIPRPLLMIDDDVSHIETSEKRSKARIDKHIKLTSDQTLQMIASGFILAEEFGCKMWGIGVNTDSRNYQQYKPFSLSNVVLGPFQAHLEHDLIFDERMGTKEDYDMSLQMLNKYKKILRINKYNYSCGHGVNDGGIVSYRTMEKEIEFCRNIEKKWGRDIISYPLKPKTLAEVLNGNVNIPIKGV